MKIAFVTPLSPEKTGIADFSEEILLFLNKYFEIDLFSSHTKPSNRLIADNFKVFKYDKLEDENIRKQYDRIIYQIGNNVEKHGEIYKLALKYKGIIELHDISLEGLIWGLTLKNENRDKYLDIVEYCHGKKARERAEGAFNGECLPLWNEPIDFPLNKEIIDASDSIIVHSDLGFQIVKGINPNIKVAKIYHHTNDIYENFKEMKELYKKELKLDNKLIISSFGFATKTKRIPQILEALSEVKKNGYDFTYIIAGKVEEEIEMEKLVKNFNLQDYVKITGYLSLDDLKKYMLATDVCFSLRYPSHGESSGIFHRILGMGKFVIVTDDGTFSEYPNYVCEKIQMEDEIGNIKKIILNIINGKINLHSYEENAIKYAKENFDLEENILMYKSFIEDSSNAVLYDPLDILSEYIYNLGITDEEIIKSL